MTSTILLTGGTGTLGRHVLPLLRDAGAKVRVLSRGDHASADGVEYVTGDLATGAGIDAAVDGVETIVHCAGSAKGDDDKTRTAGTGGGARRRRPAPGVHLGGRRRPGPGGQRRRPRAFGYFAAKRAAERVVAESGLPWTTLRATQFHDLILTVAAADGEAAGDAGAGRRALPAGGHRRGGRRGWSSWRSASRPASCPTSAGRGCTAWTELMRGYLRAHRPPPADPADAGARQGVPRDARRRQPGPGPGGRPPDLGGVPRRAGARGPLARVRRGRPQGGPRRLRPSA